MNALSRVVSDLTQKKGGSRKLKYETTSSTTSGWDEEDINPMAFCSPFHDPVLQQQSSLNFASSLSNNKSGENESATTTHQSQNRHQQQGRKADDDKNSTPTTKDIPVLEKGSLNLNELDYDMRFLKKPNPPLKRMSAAFRQHFSTDFLRSKSLQKLNNKDEEDPKNHNQANGATAMDGFEDGGCKHTTSLGKFKQQARIIDVHVNYLNGSRKNTDNKNLLKHDEMDSD